MKGEYECLEQNFALVLRLDKNLTCTQLSSTFLNQNFKFQPETCIVLELRFA